jgi:hypothetical protein
VCDVPKFWIVVHDLGSYVEREIHNGVNHVNDAINGGNVWPYDPGPHVVIGYKDYKAMADKIDQKISNTAVDYCKKIVNLKITFKIMF